MKTAKLREGVNLDSYSWVAVAKKISNLTIANW